LDAKFPNEKEEVGCELKLNVVEVGVVDPNMKPELELQKK
jgi:hypothetical protein